VIVKPFPGRARKRLLNHGGASAGEIMFVLDPRIQAEDKPSVTRPLSEHHRDFIRPMIDQVGIPKDKLYLLSSAQPVTKEDFDRERALNAKVALDRSEFLREVQAKKPRLILAMGKCAARQVTGKAVKITKIRGVPFYSDELGCIVLPTLGPSHVARMPEHRDTLLADLDTAARIANSGYVLNYNEQVDVDYQWCWDLRKYIPLFRSSGLISVDAEWTSYGLDEANSWYCPNMKILTIQIC
jgi:uracil-DNA glycosylase family 4